MNGRNGKGRERQGESKRVRAVCACEVKDEKGE